MSVVPITVGTVQVICDICKTGKWLWHRRTLQARYEMYAAHVGKLEALHRLTASQRVVVNAEKKRIYLKMLRLWISNENLRAANPLRGLLQSMAAAGVKQNDLEIAEQAAVISGLDDELGSNGGAQALADAGL